MSCFTRVQEVSLSKGAAKHGPVNPNRAVVLVRVLARDFVLSASQSNGLGTVTATCMDWWLAKISCSSFVSRHGWLRVSKKKKCSTLVNNKLPTHCVRQAGTYSGATLDNKIGKCYSRRRSGWSLRSASKQAINRQTHRRTDASACTEWYKHIHTITTENQCNNDSWYNTCHNLT